MAVRRIRQAPFACRDGGIGSYSRFLLWWPSLCLGGMVLLLSLVHCLDVQLVYVSPAGGVTVAWWALGIITACVASPYVVLMYVPHRRRLAIWMLHGSEPSEQIEGARLLAIWCVPCWPINKPIPKYIEESLDDVDPAAAQAARRAVSALAFWQNMRRFRPNWRNMKFIGWQPFRRKEKK